MYIRHHLGINMNDFSHFETSYFYIDKLMNLGFFSSIKMNLPTVF